MKKNKTTRGAKRFKRQIKNLKKQIKNNNKKSRRPRNKRRSISISNIPGAYSSPIRNIGACNSIRFQHREFVTDVTPTTNPEIVTYPVNPGLDIIFPWLSLLAAGFESYKFHRLRFRFIPAVGTTVAGTIAMIPDYDSADAISTDKSSLLAHQDSIIGQIYKGLTLNCRPRNLVKAKEWYLRYGNLTANLDIKTYDICNLIVFIQTASTDTIGSLWVEYDVSLLTPQKHASSFESLWNEIDYPYSASSPFSDTRKVDNALTLNTSIDIERTSSTVLELTEAGYYIISTYAHDALSGITGVDDIVLTGAANTTISEDKDYTVDDATSWHIFWTAASALAPLVLTWAGVTSPTISSFEVLVSKLDPAILGSSTATQRLERKKKIKMEKTVSLKNSNKKSNYLNFSNMITQLTSKPKKFTSVEILAIEIEALKETTTIKEVVQMLTVENWIRKNHNPDYTGLSEDLNAKINKFINLESK